MNFEHAITEALVIIAYMVVLVIALGLAEISINIVSNIVDNVRRINSYWKVK